MGRCTTCECNGNIDPALGPVCDITTGQCLNCLNNTTGFECELCLPGYFGDPQISKPCRRKLIHIAVDFFPLIYYVMQLVHVILGALLVIVTLYLERVSANLVQRDSCAMSV